MSLFNFGASAAPSTSSPAPAFGGFGSLGQTSQPQQQQGTPATSAPAAGGLFSSFAPAQSSSTPSLFGQPQQQQQNQQQGSSLFKPLGSTQTSQPGSTPSLFGASSTTPQQPQQQQQSTGGLFGSGFGGAQPQQQQQQQQQQPQPFGQPSLPQPAVNTLNKNAKFEELSEGERKALQDLENMIQGKKAIEEDLKSRDFGASIAKTASSLRDVSVEYTSLLSVLEQARSNASDLRQRFQLDLEDICKAVRIVDNFKGNASASMVNQTTKGVVDGKFPYKFFKKKTDELADRVKLYQDTVDTLQAQVNVHQESDQVKAILPTLRAQHALSLALASKLAAMHDDLEEMKQVYAYLWRQRGSFSALRDPFVEAGLTDSATAYPSTTSNQLKSLQL